MNEGWTSVKIILPNGGEVVVRGNAVEFGQGGSLIVKMGSELVYACAPHAWNSIQKVLP